MASRARCCVSKARLPAELALAGGDDSNRLLLREELGRLNLPTAASVHASLKIESINSSPAPPPSSQACGDSTPIVATEVQRLPNLGTII
eukprot:COSAG02_NODE_566_length_20219_cov_13.531759_14_plen_90_part_00